MKSLALAPILLALVATPTLAAETWARVSQIRSQLSAYRVESVVPAKGAATGKVTVLSFAPDGIPYQGKTIRFSLTERTVNCADLTITMGPTDLFDLDGALLGSISMAGAPPQNGSAAWADRDLGKLVCEGKPPTIYATTHSARDAMAEIRKTAEASP